VLSLLSSEVHDRLLRFVDVEGEVNSLAPLNVVVGAFSFVWLLPSIQGYWFG
jgi:hypothetical protein